MSDNKRGLILYLTSSAVGEYRVNGIDYKGLNPKNGLVSALRKDWTDEARCLLIAADPDDHANNVGTAGFLSEKLSENDLSVGCFDVCDAENPVDPIRDLNRYDFIVLNGGHVPTQNAFFREIGLFERIQTYRGIVMGISAGTMNCATFVYAQPELSGEATDPHYEKFIDGLDLTSIQILPHYQSVKNDVIDGKRLFEDITLLDSYGHRFYAIPDGSYVLQRGGTAVLHGEAWCVQDGKMTKICEEEHALIIPLERAF